MAVLDKIKKLTSQLFPTGLAFRMPVGGNLQKLRDGLAMSEKRLHDDLTSILDSMLPDNSNFTANDATALEEDYGLVTNTNVSLADRKLAIARKIAHPGGIPARQHYLYVERELRAAGFDVYVHENLNRTDPHFFFGNAGSQHGDFQHGDSQHGGFTTNQKVANSLSNDEDSTFNVGTTYSNVFIIGGGYLGDYANIDADREVEFRQLILKLKPQNQIAFLLITYN